MADYNKNPLYLHPILQARLGGILKEVTDALPEKWRATTGGAGIHRTPAEQFEIYKQGRTFKNGTWVKTGTVHTYKDGYTSLSRHNYLPATSVDIVLIQPNGEELAAGPQEKLIKKGAVKYGLDWGGDWTKFTDMPHIEIPTSMLFKGSLEMDMALQWQKYLHRAGALTAESDLDGLWGSNSKDALAEVTGSRERTTAVWRQLFEQFGPLESLVPQDGGVKSHSLAVEIPKATVNTKPNDPLTVRNAPKKNAKPVGSLPNGTVVEIHDKSGIWRRISPTEARWVSGNYLVPITSGGVGSGGGTSEGARRIIEISANSALSSFDWPQGHHRVARGFTKGMALAFARTYCKLLAGDPIAVETAGPIVEDPEVDSLYRARAKFAEAGLSLQGTPADILRKVYVLLMGLGVNESDGKWNEGRYMKDDFAEHDSAEAGIFQTAYGITYKHENAQRLYASYRGKTDAWLPVFQEGVPPNPAGLVNWGDGPGVEFQQLSKYSPTFAAEMAALRVRTKPGHWAPLRDHYVMITAVAEQMFRDVQAEIDAAGTCPVFM